MTDQFTVDGIFHARLTSKRESKSGIFLTIQLTPDDFSPDLAQLRAGSLLKMGWQEMVDVSVQPIELENSLGDGPPLSTVPRPQADKAGISKPKERFEDMPLVKQAVLRGGDAEFRAFLASRYAAVWRECHDLGKDMDERAAIVIRRLCNVNSRADIVAGRFTGDQWLALESEFLKWKLDQRYPAGSRR